MSEIPRIENVQVEGIGLFTIPPPETISTPHVSLELDLNKPVFDWQIPSYEPMEWNLKEMKLVETKGPPVAPPPPTPPTPPPVDPSDVEIECPGPNNLRVGDIRNAEAKEKVVSHEIVEGKCIEIYAPTTFVDKYLPSPSAASTTFGITIVATAAASLTPILTKALKPVFKQIINRVKKLFGKKIERPGLSELRSNSYREKKGLPPLKAKK